MDNDRVHVATPIQTAPASNEPRFPPELERIIFKTAARNDRDRGIPTLMQVARRVQDWLQPIIYDTVILPSAQLYNRSKGSRRPPPRFPSGPQTLHVRSFLVSNHRLSPSDGADEPNWEDLLPQCHNLLNLAIWTPPSPDTLSALTSILHSPLRTVAPRGLLRLSLSPERLFHGGRVDLRHEIFRHLTHLELPYGDRRREWARDIPECIPQLRYLWIWIRRIPYVEVIRQILDECRFLEVFILSDNSNIYAEELDEMIKAGRRIVNADGVVEMVPEDRVVVYDQPFSGFSQWTKVWYQGVVDGISSTVAGYDMWLRSEKIIERRRWRRQLEAVLWSSLIYSDVDVDLGEWMSNMDMY